MDFLRKHFLGTTIFLLAVTCLSLYLFLMKPVLIRRQEVVRATEEKLAQLRGHKEDPPSSEMVARLDRKKERLERQYEKIVKEMNFAKRMSLPEDIGDPLFLDEQIEKFERQVERTESKLDRLAREAGINLPRRLGLREERPESQEELSVLLSQLLLARELAILVIGVGVSELSVLNPVLFPREREVATLPPSRREMPPGMEMSEREREARERGMREREMRPPEMDMGMPGREMLLGIEELGFELGVRAEISALTNLLHQIANYSYFFTVRDLEIRSMAVRRERVLPEVRERDRRRRVDRRREMPPGMEMSEREREARERGMREMSEREREARERGMRERWLGREMLPEMEPEEIGRELEARLLVSARLLPLPEKED